MSARKQKLINEPEDIVDEMLAGFCAAYHDIVRLQGDRLVLLPSWRASARPIAALGDGDHGTSVSAAFAAGVADIAELRQPSASDIWLATAKALMHRMGGASGALFGTFFLKGAVLLRGKERVSKSDMEAVLLAGLQGVKARGKAEVGDKTMVDALAPAVKAFCAAEDFARGWIEAAKEAGSGGEEPNTLASAPSVISIRARQASP